ncbi:MAG: FHA domain-containing protein [Candidatus Dormibacteria bacterium]
MNRAGLLALRAADGATVTLERYPILLGRSAAGGVVPDVDVCHLDPGGAVDNRHLELDRVPQGLEVHDLGGTGGTWVDGRRLPPGGRALLEVGSLLRVASVQLTLVQATSASPSPATESEPAPWLEGRSADAVPPPPSAGALVREEVEESPNPAVLDFSGAPALAREALERGAELVRLRPGSPLEVLRAGEWSLVGRTVGQAAATDALEMARRLLGSRRGALSDQGHVGDLALDFVAPPLTDRIYLSAARAPRQPAPLDWGQLERACQEVERGATLLVAASWPEPALAALAQRFEHGGAGPRLLSFAGSDWWVPVGWAVLDSSHPDVVQEALRQAPLFLVEPPEPVLDELLRVLPRAEGGTVVALRRASLRGTLEHFLSRLEALEGQNPASLQRSLPHLPDLGLGAGPRGWEFVRLGLDLGGRCELLPLEAEPEGGRG